MMDLFTELFDMIDGMGAYSVSPTVNQYGKKCPVCGRTWNDFAKTGKFGCGECYNTFRPLAEQAIRQVQSSSVHSGKIPSNSAADIKAKRHLEELKKQLKDAVKKEEYETAARLHAEIKELEGGTGK